MTAIRFTTRDLELLPEKEGVRYEIIDGELYVTTAPSWQHQYTIQAIGTALRNWDLESGLGFTLPGIGLIFGEPDAVIPDLVWVSKARLAQVVGSGGHLFAAPEIIIEVLSPGTTNRARDLEIKLGLYSRQQVPEYWVAGWEQKRLDLYRREGDELRLAATLGEGDTLTSALLPGFTCPVASLFPPPLAS